MADQLVAAANIATPFTDFSSWMLVEQRRVFMLCRRMLQDPEEADSATQDVFLKAYRALEKQEPIDDASRWVTRIAVNTCLDRLRSKRWQFWRKRPDAADESIILSMTPSAGPTSEDKVFAKEIAARLSAALDELSGRQRAVFCLRHYEGKNLEEIADILDLDVGTVKAHMARAMARLREDLKDLYALTGR